MAIKFLQNVSLEGGELQNIILHPLSSDPSGLGATDQGRIHYNTTSDVVKYWNGSAFITLSSSVGDITSVQDGNGLTGGADSGDVTLAVGAGNGITVNTNDVAVTAAQTTITSVLNTSLVLGRDADNQIKFATDNQIIFRVGAGDGVTFKASGEIEATKFDGALEGNADTATALATARAINGVDFDGTAAITVTAAAGTLTGSTLNSGVTASSLTSVGTIATGVWNGTAIAHDYIGLDAIDDTNIADSSIKNEHLNKLAITGFADIGAALADEDTFLVHDDSAGALKEATMDRLQTYMQNNLSFTNDTNTNTGVDMTNATLLTKLAALESTSGAANENIVIGTDSGDTIVITGNLQVQGTTTTVDSTTVAIGDHNIVLDKDNSTSAVVDGAGITLEGGSGNDVTFMWSAGNSRMELKEGSSATDLLVGTVTGALTGNADTATVATSITATANNSANETVYLTFVDGATGTQGIETDTGLSYNPSTGIISGGLSGNVTGDLQGNVTGDVTGNASTATKIASITNSNIVQLTDTQTLTNKTLTSPTLTSPALGTPASGNLANCTFPTLNQNTTGSAATLTTARTINGEPFDGSANIATGYADDTVGDNSATSITVNHGLGSRNVVVQVFETDSPYDQVFCEIERTDANNVELKFRTAPTTDQYTCVVNRVI